MKILHRYIFQILIRNFLLGLSTFSLLFLLFDFFDRIDNILGEKASVSTVFLYFVLKLPFMVHLMLPLSLMFAVLFTFGLLSKSSEITAMRASGLSIFWLSRPLIIFSACVSLFAFALNELVVPITERRQKEIYNIDIKKKDQLGSYNQSDFWWRDEKMFFSGALFDSRDNTILDFSSFEISPQWRFSKRTDAQKVKWLDPVLGWSMQQVEVSRFHGPTVQRSFVNQLPVAISAQPKDFYEFRDEPQTMNFSELSSYIKQQKNNGLPTGQYLADLYQKLSFPFISVVIPLVVLPFALKPARSGSMALSSGAAIAIGFSYYVVDSFSIAMGRAELMPALLAAWMANIILGGIGVIFALGAESPG